MDHSGSSRPDFQWGNDVIVTVKQEKSRSSIIFFCQQMLRITRVKPVAEQTVTKCWRWRGFNECQTTVLRLSAASAMQCASITMETMSESAA